MVKPCPNIVEKPVIVKAQITVKQKGRIGYWHKICNSVNGATIYKQKDSLQVKCGMKAQCCSVLNFI